MWLGAPEATGESSTLPLPFRAQHSVSCYHYTVQVFQSNHPVQRTDYSRRTETQALLHETQQTLDFEHSAALKGDAMCP